MNTRLLLLRHFSLALAVTCALLLEACSEPGAIDETRAVASTPLLHPHVPLSGSDLPSYARFGQRQMSDTLRASGKYGSADVFVRLRASVPPPTSGVDLREVHTDHPTFQSVAVGADHLGKAYIVVCMTDFTARESVLQLFTDNDGDNLPDQSTKATLATISSVELTQIAVDESSGTLYAMDPSNDRVLRFADTTGDQVPEGSFSVFFSGSAGSVLGPRAIGSPLSDSVRINIAHADRSSSPHRRLLCTDTDADGIADSATMVGPFGPAAIGHWGIFLDQPAGAESSVELRVNSAANWKIEGDDGGSWAQLATFTGVNYVPQTVTLNRVLVAGERLRLVESASGGVTEVSAVFGNDEGLFLSIKDGSFAFAEGASVTVRGKYMTGLEIVKVRINEDDEILRACVVGTVSSTELPFTVPEMTLTGPKMLEVYVWRDAAALAIDDYVKFFITAVPN